MTQHKLSSDVRDVLTVRLRVTGDEASWRDISVQTHPGVLTGQVVEDLAKVLPGAPTPAALYVDAQPLPDSVPWAQAAPRDGTSVRLGPPGQVPDPRGAASLARPSRYELAVVGGPLAGLRLQLAPGQSTLGRGSAAGLRLADPELSREHLRVHVNDEGVTIEDPGSTNRTLVNGDLLKQRRFLTDTDIVTIGRSQVAFRRAAPVSTPLGRAPGSARWVINRPPRGRNEPPGLPALVVPDPPTPARRFRLPWAAVLLPLIASAGIVVATGRLLYLAFAGLAPLIAVASYGSERRSQRQELRVRAAEYAEAQKAYESQLSAAVQVFRAAIRSQSPDLAQIHAAAVGPTDLLWQRTPSDPDFLQVRIGSASGPVPLDIRTSRGVRQPSPTSRDLPVLLPLCEAGMVGVAGDPESRDAVVRCLLAQALTLHLPTDLRVTVITTSARWDTWQWLKWAPHTWGRGEEGGSGEIATNEESAARCVAAAIASSSAHRLVVVDEGYRVDTSPAAARLLLDGPPSGITAVVLTRRFGDLPRACRATVSVDPRTTKAEIRFPDGEVVTDVRLDELSPDLAEDLARALAGWADPESLGSAAGTTGGGLPDRVGFLESLSYPDLSPEAIATRWRSPSGALPVALCGVGEGGPVTVDLRSGYGGPNAFLAGTTGSGKSDFLRGFLTSLALNNPPDALNMILIDFKEGSGLEILDRLPHVASIVTNYDRAHLPRILTALTAERELRQHRLKAAGYDSFDDYQMSAGSEGGMPRLLVVVDEFAALRESVPEAMARLVEIVRRGRSAGMHLLLGTQTVSTAVSQDIADNTTVHVCLRVEKDSESRVLVGIPDAAFLPPRAQGRGFVSDGQSVRAFQTGWVGHRGTEQESRSVTIAEFAPGSTAPSPVGRTEAAPASDLQRVIGALRDAADLLHLEPARPPWEPPLPTRVALSQLPGLPGEALSHGRLLLRLGLLDSPRRRAQIPWEVDLDSTGHLLIVGGSRSGRSTFLRTVACAASLEADPGSLHVYAIEGAGRSLAGLAILPTVGAVVAADDVERLARLLRQLRLQAAARQQLLQETSAGSLSELRQRMSGVPARVLVLIDGFDALHDDSFADDGESALSQITALVREGPAVGLHLVVTTDASKAHTRLVSSLGNRIVLALPEPAQYQSVGVAREDTPISDPPPGRGIWVASGEEVQLALLDVDPGGAAQQEAIERIAHSLRTRLAARSSDLLPPPIPAWASRYRLDELGRSTAPEAWDVILGVGGDLLEPTTLRLRDCAPGLLVVGPRRSGRTQTLVTIATQLTDGSAQRPGVVVVTPRGGDLATSTTRLTAASRLDGPDALSALPDILTSSVEPLVVLVDDADRLVDGTAGLVMDSALTIAAERGHVLVAAGTTADLAQQARSWVARLKRNRTAVVLRPPSRAELQMFGLSAPPRAAEPISAPGRGLLFQDGESIRIQVAIT